MKNIKQIVGERLSSFRRERGYTQEKLAEKVGLTSTSISNIERGETWPEYENLEAIAQALNIPQTAFLSSDVIHIKTEPSNIEILELVSKALDGKKVFRVKKKRDPILEEILETWQYAKETDKDTILKVLKNRVPKDEKKKSNDPS